MTQYIITAAAVVSGLSVLGAAAVAAIALLVYAICKKPHGKNA